MGDAIRISVIHGPNLNLLGQREPEIYGTATLEEVNDRLRRIADDLGVTVCFLQSNDEAALIDHVQGLSSTCDGILINAAGLTHTSVSLRDALVAVQLPFVEVHLSNIYAREPFRRQSMLSDAARAVICGFGPASYELALTGLVEQLRPKGSV